MKRLYLIFAFILISSIHSYCQFTNIDMTKNRGDIIKAVLAHDKSNFVTFRTESEEKCFYNFGGNIDLDTSKLNSVGAT